MATQSAFAKYVASGAANRAANAAVQAAVTRQIAAGLVVDGSLKREATGTEKQLLSEATLNRGSDAEPETCSATNPSGFMNPTRPREGSD